MGSGTSTGPVLTRAGLHAGLDARVEPFWKAFEARAPELGVVQRWRERRRLKHAVDTIDARIRAAGGDPAGWSGRKGDRVCNLKVAKMGLVAELQRLLRHGLEGGADAWPHLAAVRDWGAVAVPAEFGAPFEIASGRRDRDRLAIVSVPRLRAELDDVNARLRVDETFALRKMVDFLDATERDISMYESRFGTQEGFWAKFAFVLLRKLTDRASEHALPVFFT